ncbi:zf-HC2 domain-containing protein [Pseudogracilibacillus sp. SO30301A]|uniref:zf-HC2 domain-containing protein n=1 Tax=Pseudogracilibacillus sp. SO30301A TaxID=3098291 RepID=UPI00300E0533
MKHNVFKDLAPAYIDQLTSEETNKQMEKHMDQCEDCRKYLNKMKEDIFVEHKVERKKEHSSIDYFKKVRAKNRKKVFVIVSSLLSVFLILITIYYFMFVNMWLADTDNVETSLQNQGMTVTLSFKSKKANHYLLTQDAMSDEGYIDSIFVYEKRDDFSTPAELLKDGINVTYTFLDENTLLLDNGTKHKIKDDDIVSIHYKDRIEEIFVKDLYDTNNESK